MSTGGGHIIIRSLLRKVAETSTVKDSLLPEDLQRLNTILAKKEADWTRRDDRFVLTSIGGALEDCAV